MEARPLAQARLKGSVPVCGFAVMVVVLTFVESIHRLGLRALATVRSELSPLQWALLCVSIASFSYWEGYRVLGRRFAPAVVARAMWAAQTRRGIVAFVIAPLQALGLACESRSVLIHSWVSVFLIAGAVLVVRALPEPARGMVDAGVTSALLWGLFALLVEFRRAVQPLRAAVPLSKGIETSRA